MSFEDLRKDCLEVANRHPNATPEELRDIAERFQKLADQREDNEEVF